MPQTMEAGRGQLTIPYRMTPVSAQLVGRVGLPIRQVRENKISIAEAAQPDRKAVFEKLSAMGVENINHIERQADPAPTMSRLWRFETQPIRGLFQAALDRDRTPFQVDRAPY